MNDVKQRINGGGLRIYVSVRFIIAGDMIESLFATEMVARSVSETLEANV